MHVSGLKNRWVAHYDGVLKYIYAFIIQGASIVFGVLSRKHFTFYVDAKLMT